MAPDLPLRRIFMQVVIGHDSFTQLGGAEKVVDVFHELFPDAPVYALVQDKKLDHKYRSWDIRTSWLQYLFRWYPKFQHLFFLTPFASGSVLVRADVLLTSSSSFAKGFKIQKPGIHVCYCHTPTRFLWIDEGYVDHEVPRILRPLVHLFLKWMRVWDLRAAGRIDCFIANSRETQRRIRQFYGRDSTVIYPPVDVHFWSGGEAEEKSDYFLLAGRLQPYKQNDLIIKIFNELGLPLHVVGTGRQEAYLKSIAGPNVTFYGRVSDHELRRQYRRALAFVYPQIEDAGLMPLEAAACGTASIGIAKGGSVETIVPGVTGELFQDYNPSEIKQIITSWNVAKYLKNNLLEHARTFDKQNFKSAVEQLMQECLKQRPHPYEHSH